MGKQSRAKRERREQSGLLSSMTACEGTAFERPPDAEEQAHIAAADRELRKYRLQAMQMGADQETFNKFSLQIYRDERFAPLYFSDDLIETIIEEQGEPPIVQDDSDPAFSNYLLASLSTVASARLRRVLAEQSRRFLPKYVQIGLIREALALEHNAYMTVMSDAATPLLVQMLVGGLARWYEENEDEKAES